MIRTAMAAALGLLVAAGVSQTSARAGEASNGSTCFFLSQFEDWKAPDAQTIYIRVRQHDYYRLDLKGACSTLKSPGAHLTVKARGKDTICSPLDWDLTVSQSPPGAEEGCVVGAMTLLTPEAVAAIPKPFKP